MANVFGWARLVPTLLFCCDCFGGGGEYSGSWFTILNANSSMQDRPKFPLNYKYFYSDTWCKEPWCTNCGTETEDIVVELGSASIRLPRRYLGSGDTLFPVVIHLHGFGSCPRSILKHPPMMRLSENSSDNEFDAIHIMPLGANYGWDAGACCKLHTSPGRNDEDFLEQVLDNVEQSYKVDATRVYVMGVSSGAFMSNALACKLSERITAVVAISGALDVPCQPSRPVPVLTIWGTEDKIVLYDGGKLIGDVYPGAHKSFATWTSLNNCTAEEKAAAPYDFPPSVKVRRGIGCSLNNAPELWSVDQMGHFSTKPERTNLTSEQLTLGFMKWMFQYRIDQPTVAPEGGDVSLSGLDTDGASFFRSYCILGQVSVVAVMIRNAIIV